MDRKRVERLVNELIEETKDGCPAFAAAVCALMAALILGGPALAPWSNLAQRQARAMIAEHELRLRPLA